MQKLILALFLLILSLNIQAQKTYKFKSIKGKYDGIRTAYLNLSDEDKRRIIPGMDYYFKIGAIQATYYKTPNPNNHFGGFVDIYYGYTKRDGDTISFYAQKKRFSTKISTLDRKNKVFKQRKIDSNKPMYRFLISENEHGDITLSDLNDEFIFVRMRDQRFQFRKRF